MRYHNIRLCCYCAIFLACSLKLQAQTPPQWLQEYHGPAAMVYQAMHITSLEDAPYILTYTTDSFCTTPHYSVVHFSSTGNYLNQTDYGDSTCQPVHPNEMLSIDNKITVVANDSAQTLSAVGILVSYDADLNFLNRGRAGMTAEDPAVSTTGQMIGVFSESSTVTLFCLDTSGVNLWNIADPILFGVTNGFHHLKIESDTVYTMCSGRVNATQNTRSVVIGVIDISGNFVDTISYDPYPAVNEQVIDILHCQDNFVYAATMSTSNGNSRVGDIDRSGTLLWELAVPEIVRSISYDSTTNQVLLFTSQNAFATTWHFYRINQTTGVVLDSSAIDSVFGGYQAVKFVHEEGCGVYMAYRNSTAVNTYHVERFNVYGLNDWTGLFLTSSSYAYFLEEVHLNSDRSLYITGWTLSDSILICKFSPPPLGLHEFAQEHSIHIFPNPANSTVGISIYGLSGENEVLIYSCSGVLNFSFENVSDYETLSLEGCVPGLYFIEVIPDSGMRSTQKLIIQH